MKECVGIDDDDFIGVFIFVYFFLMGEDCLIMLEIFFGVFIFYEMGIFLGIVMGVFSKFCVVGGCIGELVIEKCGLNVGEKWGCLFGFFYLFVVGC